MYIIKFILVKFNAILRRLFYGRSAVLVFAVLSFKCKVVNKIGKMELLQFMQCFFTLLDNSDYCIFTRGFTFWHTQRGFVILWMNF